VAAYCLWAKDHDPGSVEGAVGYVLRAQEMHDLRAIRRALTAPAPNGG
jgi:hypothetical protein